VPPTAGVPPGLLNPKITGSIAVRSILRSAAVFQLFEIARDGVRVVQVGKRVHGRVTLDREFTGLISAARLNVLKAIQYE
jgi:hypothetical protein